MSDIDEEKAQTLSIGVINYGQTPKNRGWDLRTQKIMNQVATAREGIASDLNVNVVFVVPGWAVRIDFEGVRTGSFRKRDSLLMVQVALPEEPPPDDHYLVDQTYEAIDAAEAWAIRRKKDIDFGPLRSILAKL